MEITITFKDKSSSHTKLEIPTKYGKRNLPIMYEINFENISYCKGDQMQEIIPAKSVLSNKGFDDTKIELADSILNHTSTTFDAINSQRVNIKHVLTMESIMTRKQESSSTMIEDEIQANKVEYTSEIHGEPILYTLEEESSILIINNILTKRYSVYANNIDGYINSKKKLYSSIKNLDIMKSIIKPSRSYAYNYNNALATTKPPQVLQFNKQFIGTLIIKDGIHIVEDDNALRVVSNGIINPIQLLSKCQDIYNHILGEQYIGIIPDDLAIEVEGKVISAKYNKSEAYKYTISDIFTKYNKTKGHINDIEDVSNIEDTYATVGELNIYMSNYYKQAEIPIKIVSTSKEDTYAINDMICDTTNKISYASMKEEDYTTFNNIIRNVFKNDDVVDVMNDNKPSYSLLDMLNTLKTTGRNISIENILSSDPIKRYGEVGEKIVFVNRNKNISELLESYIASIEDEFNIILKMNPKDPNAFDILDIPNSDMSYKNLQLKAYDESGRPTIPIGDVTQPKVRVQMPNIHYNSDYADIGLMRTPVKVSTLKEIIVTMCQLKKEYMMQLANTDPKTAVNYILDKLWNRLLIIKDVVPPEAVKEYDRVFRLVRWYGETAVVRNCHYWLIREYGDYVEPIYKEDLSKLQYIKSNIGFTSSNLVLLNNDVNGSIELEFESFVDAESLIIIDNQSTNPKELRGKITIDGEVTILNSASVNIIKPQLGLGIHNILIESMSDLLKISTIRLGGTIFKNATTEYIKNSADGLAVITELNKMLIHYFSIHHEDKVKSNKQVIIKN